MMALYKFTGPNGKTYNGYKWPLPTKNDDGTWTPGEWTEPIEGELIACENGYHLTDKNHLAQWINAELYTVEHKGELIQTAGEPDKWVVRQARLTSKIEAWNDKNARLFAVWCARKALALIDNPDPRSVEAVNVAEKYANGEATDNELAAAWAAARAAAWDAARAAAWAAARDAAWDAQNKYLQATILDRQEMAEKAGA